MEIVGSFGGVTSYPPRGPEPERHEVEIVVVFDDVGPQPVVLQAYALVLDEGLQPGDQVRAVSEGTQLTVRRRW